MKTKMLFVILAMTLGIHTFAQVVSEKRAQKIFGNNFLGPEAIEKTFGFRPNEISIPFSGNELKKAKKLGMILILQVSRFPDGRSITMHQIYNILGHSNTINTERVTISENQNSMYISEIDDPFFTNEVPVFGWKLVKELPKTANQNFLQQTKSMINYLVAEIYENKEVPGKYQKAIDGFYTQERNLEEIIQMDWQKAASEMMKLEVNQLLRETPVEVLYRCVLYEKQNKEQILSQSLIWTKRRYSPNGGIIFIGKYDGKSAWINGFRSSDAHPDLITTISIISSGK